MTRKRWSELSGRQQAAIVATVVVQEAWPPPPSGLRCPPRRRRGRSRARRYGGSALTRATFNRWNDTLDCVAPRPRVGKPGERERTRAGRPIQIPECRPRELVPRQATLCLVACLGLDQSRPAASKTRHSTTRPFATTARHRAGPASAAMEQSERPCVSTIPPGLLRTLSNTLR